MLNKGDIVRKMREFRFPAHEYWVTAGAGLVMHEVKAETRDIDIGCSSSLAEILIQSGRNWYRLEDGTRRIEIDSQTEAFENWLVDEVTQMDGISVATLSSIRKQKVDLNREKDWQDIRLIDEFVCRK